MCALRSNEGQARWWIRYRPEVLPFSHPSNAPIAMSIFPSPKWEITYAPPPPKVCKTPNSLPTEMQCSSFLASQPPIKHHNVVDGPFAPGKKPAMTPKLDQPPPPRLDTIGECACTPSGSCSASETDQSHLQLQLFRLSDCPSPRMVVQQVVQEVSLLSKSPQVENPPINYLHEVRPLPCPRGHPQMTLYFRKIMLFPLFHCPGQDV